MNSNPLNDKNANLHTPLITYIPTWDAIDLGDAINSAFAHVLFSTNDKIAFFTTTKTKLTEFYLVDLSLNFFSKT